MPAHTPGNGKCKQWAGINLEIRAAVNFDTWTGTHLDIREVSNIEFNWESMAGYNVNITAKKSVALLGP